MSLPWEAYETDEIEEDFNDGLLGLRDPFEDWPVDAYLNHPMYRMYLDQYTSDLTPF